MTTDSKVTDARLKYLRTVALRFQQSSATRAELWMYRDAVAAFEELQRFREQEAVNREAYSR